ncbi:hypothetical protein WISP_94951 [Willisornis vidua]|uniref:ribonuclease H n=1 Tax=Willisornis vidua TaxID=1566151 RepID=A0ABQ9D025_9PASS|nr:hypothetical protein WISP_94951 [Willisornis vidua]
MTTPTNTEALKGTFLVTGMAQAADMGRVIVPTVLTVTDANSFSVFIKPSFFPVEFLPEDNIVQLLLLKGVQHNKDFSMGGLVTGQNNGSTNARLFSFPNLGRRINVNEFLDTGADVTVVADKDWPQEWPTLIPSIDIRGGMKNSPTISQTMVSQILGPVRQKYPGEVIYHYMDDILFSASDLPKLKSVHDSVAEALVAYGLEVPLEKTETTTPWQYLGLLLSSKIFVPQKVVISTKMKTLKQLQVLLGNIDWVRSYLGLSTDFLAPLF